MDATEAAKWVKAACHADPKTADAFEVLEADRKAKREAIRDIFRMMDDCILVRNTDKDDKPDWAFRTMKLIERLSAARKAGEIDDSHRRTDF